MLNKTIITIITILTLTIIMSGIVVVKQSSYMPNKEDGKIQEDKLTNNAEQTKERQGDENVEVLTSDVDLSAEVLAKVDTSNWKTYRNEEYGFEFKYPEGWEIRDRGDFISLILPVNSKINGTLNILAILNIHSTSGNLDALVVKQKSLLKEPWSKELSIDKYVKERSFVNNQNTITYLGPLSPPSNMTNNAIFIVSNSERNVIMSLVIMGGSVDVILNQALIISDSVHIY